MAIIVAMCRLATTLVKGRRLMTSNGSGSQRKLSRSGVLSRLVEQTRLLRASRSVHIWRYGMFGEDVSFI